jgi:hypothetical protein
VAFDKSNAPVVAIAQVSSVLDAPGYWTILWEVRNASAGAITIASVRLPHGQFKAAEQRFEPALDLAPGAAARFETRVHCDEPPGFVTENAFLIFHVLWRGEEWRVFVRVRVVVAAQGEPQTSTELITAQRVGFSGLAN